jgi:hypothetical protein
MKKVHQFRATELGMLVYEMTREHARCHPDFLMGDIADRVVERYGTCRATAYRYVRTAVDVLGIDYDAVARMKLHRSDRCADGLADARCAGRPNGKPGRERQGCIA